MKLEKAINPLLDDDLLVAISYLFERILSEHLMNVENSWPFHHAVNKVRFKDYYDIVKTPMDLEKIKNVKPFNNHLSYFDFVLFRIFLNIHIVHVQQC
jgi:hypothetical protein